jgi:hypothetical protein
LTVTNKRFLVSESRGDSNWCTPCRGKPDTHDTYDSHASPRTPRVRFLRAVHIRGNLSQAINSVGRTLLLSRKRTPDTTPSPTEWSAGPPPSFSPNTAIEAVLKAKHMLMNKLHQFTGPITPVCSQYVQYLLVRPTHRSLTDTGGGYNLRVSAFHIPLPDLSNRLSPLSI